MKTYSVRNLEQYQHYKRRSPPWVKWHNCCLHDRDFVALPDGAKWLAVALVMHASANGNEIDGDPSWLVRCCALNSRPKDVEVWLEMLVNARFLDACKQDASNMLAGCKQVALSAEESRAEESRGNTSSLRAEVKAVFGFWQQLLDHPRAVLDEKRRRMIRARLKEHGLRRCLAAIYGLSISRFHMGDNEGGKRYDDLAHALRDAATLEARINEIHDQGAADDAKKAIGNCLGDHGRAAGEAETEADGAG